MVEVYSREEAGLNVERTIYETGSYGPIMREHLPHVVVLDYDVSQHGRTRERNELSAWMKEQKLNRFNSTKKLGDWNTVVVLLQALPPGSKNNYNRRVTGIAFRDERMALVFKMRFC